MEFLMRRRFQKQDKSYIRCAHVLESKSVIIFFFATSWCQKSNQLIPVLKMLYEENKKRQCGMEIVLVSYDEKCVPFEDFYFNKNGPWLTVPFNDYITAQKLRYKYGITCVPNIVVVKTDGTLVTTRGQQEIEAKGPDVLISWSDWYRV